jgi:diaminopimelate decarboxylase
MNDNILSNIAKKHGTPVYVYDTEIILSQFRKLKDSLPEEFQIFYSMKANPLLGLCQLFKKMGNGIEVASSGELYTALAAGFPPERIIFSSPGKTCDELEYAIECGIYSINIECLEEARIINHIAMEKSRKVDISIRINPDFDVSGSGIKMSGVPTQFGIDQNQLEEVFNLLNSFSNVNVIGVHIYTGTQVLNAHNIVLNMEQIILLALELSEKHNFELKFLDLGGGFGIPYFKGDIYLDMDNLKNELAEMWDKYERRLAKTKVFVESGRFLMAEAGTYLVKVLYKKDCKGKKYAVCDGGSNQHASSAFLGRHIRNNFPMHVLNKTENEEEVNVVGPLCTPTDVIGQNVMLPEMDTGDIIAVEKSGAYGITQSPGLFLSHPLAAEVRYDAGKTTILRKRGGKEDFLKGQMDLEEIE